MPRELTSWIQDEEWEALMNLAQEARGDIVELGTYRGGTSAGFCSNMPAEYEFYTIDNYSDPEFQAFEDYNPIEIWRKLRNIKRNAFVVVGDSAETGIYWNKNVWLVFIDACHASFNALKDFLAWGDKANYIVFHDYHKDHQGVIDAVNFILSKKLYNVTLVSTICTLVVLKRWEE